MPAAQPGVCHTKEGHLHFLQIIFVSAFPQLVAGEIHDLLQFNVSVSAATSHYFRSEDNCLMTVQMETIS